MTPAMARLAVSVRSENANLRDLRDRQLVASRCAANRFRIRSVVNAKGALAIGCDIRMNPCDAVLGVVMDHLSDEGVADLVLRNAQAFRKISFNNVARHGGSLPKFAGYFGK